MASNSSIAVGFWGCSSFRGDEGGWQMSWEGWWRERCPKERAVHRGCLCSWCSPIPSTMEQNRTLCDSRVIFTEVPLKTSPGPH